MILKIIKIKIAKRIRNRLIDHKENLENHKIRKGSQKKYQ